MSISQALKLHDEGDFIQYNLMQHLTDKRRVTQCFWCRLMVWSEKSAKYHDAKDSIIKWLRSRHYDRAEAKAYAEDAEYRRIEDLRHTTPAGRSPLGSSIRFLDEELRMEHWDYQHKVRNEILPYPRYLMILDKLDHHHLLSPRVFWRNNVTWNHQRMQRGWSERDLWSFDTYLAKVIAEGCEQLAEQVHGWPGEPMTFEEWQEILRKISRGFKAHTSIMEDHLHPKSVQYRLLEDEFEEGMDLFKNFFGHLWD